MISHILLFFHISIASIILFKSGRIKYNFAQKYIRSINYFKRILTLCVLVLISNSIIEYLNFNLLFLNAGELSLPFTRLLEEINLKGKNAKIIYSITEILWLVGNPALLLVFIPGFLKSAWETFLNRQSKALSLLLKVSSIITILIYAGLGSIVISTILFLYDITRSQIIRNFINHGSSYLQAVVYFLLLCYSLLFLIWSIKRKLFSSKLVRGGLIGIIFFLSILFLEIMNSNDIFHVPGLKNLFNLAKPYGLQLPWLLILWISVFGNLIVNKIHFDESGQNKSVSDVFQRRKLSKRETEIALLLIDGAGNKEIARKLDISYNTVKNHISSIFQKLEVGSRFELIKFLQLSDSAKANL